MNNEALVFIGSEEGDWIGMYKNGKLLLQGHSIGYWDMAKALGFTVIYREKDNEWFDKHGNRCPEELSEVKDE